MLSYMVPSTTLDDKPPQRPVKTTRLKLIIEDTEHPKVIQNNNNNTSVPNNNSFSNNSVPSSNGFNSVSNNNLGGRRNIIKTHSKQSNLSTESSASSLSSISGSDLPATHLPSSLDKTKSKVNVSSNPLPTNGHLHVSSHINVSSVPGTTLSTSSTKSATLKR